MDGHGITASASVGCNLRAPRGTVQHASETGKPQQDSSPTSQNHPSKNCLTLLSDALKKDEERPTQLPDITWQAASKPFQKHAKPCSGRGWNGSFGRSFGLGWIELIRASRTWSGRGMRNRETPAGFKPNQPRTSEHRLRNSQTPPKSRSNPAKTAPPKSLSNAAFGTLKEQGQEATKKAPRHLGKHVQQTCAKSLWAPPSKQPNTSEP